MSQVAYDANASSADPVGNLLKWILPATAVICFGLFAWATAVT